jgi:hypothetical protein
LSRAGFKKPNRRREGILDLKVKLKQKNRVREALRFNVLLVKLSLFWTIQFAFTMTNGERPVSSSPFAGGMKMFV